MNNRKLLLTYYKNREAAFLFEENRLMDIMLQTQTDCSIGDIYVGKVKSIAKNIHAAFVEYKKGCMGFLPLNDVRMQNILNRRQPDCLHCEDEILVQVSKEPLKTKECTLTTDLCFTGQFLVLTPYSRGIHYSKRFSQKQRECLRQTMSDMIPQLFGDMAVFLKRYGLIVRTNAALADIEELYNELHDLFHKACNVISVADKRCAYSCLYTDEPFFERVVRNVYKEGHTEIITDQETIYERILHMNQMENAAPLGCDNSLSEEEKQIYASFLEAESSHRNNRQPKTALPIRRYEEEKPDLFQLYGLSAKIEEATAKRVWLKAGGYLIIEPTEALTVIDVNTGKSASKKSDAESFYLKTNIEAAVEIARQLRLRNISGIIIIDFINMKDAVNREQLMDSLKREIRKDSIETMFIDMTPLGLVELTRKKTSASLAEKLSRIAVQKE